MNYYPVSFNSFKVNFLNFVDFNLSFRHFTQFQIKVVRRFVMPYGHSTTRILTPATEVCD